MRPSAECVLHVAYRDAHGIERTVSTSKPTNCAPEPEPGDLPPRRRRLVLRLGPKDNARTATLSYDTRALVDAQLAKIDDGDGSKFRVAFTFENEAGDALTVAVDQYRGHDVVRVEGSGQNDAELIAAEPGKRPYLTITYLRSGAVESTPTSAPLSTDGPTRTPRPEGTRTPTLVVPTATPTVAPPTATFTPLPPTTMPTQMPSPVPQTQTAVASNTPAPPASTSVPPSIPLVTPASRPPPTGGRIAAPTSTASAGIPPCPPSGATRRTSHGSSRCRARAAPPPPSGATACS